MTFIIDVFQFHCKSEHKQKKGNEIKGDMSKSDSAFPYLQCTILFNWLFKFNAKGLLQKWMIGVPSEKSPSFIIIP